MIFILVTIVSALKPELLKHDTKEWFRSHLQQYGHTVAAFLSLDSCWHLFQTLVCAQFVARILDGEDVTGLIPFGWEHSVNLNKNLILKD